MHYKKNLLQWSLDYRKSSSLLDVNLLYKYWGIWHKVCYADNLVNDGIKNLSGSSDLPFFVNDKFISILYE